MTRDEILQKKQNLLQEKSENNKVMASCKDQIARAKADVIVTGNYHDPHWYAAVNAAARHAGRRDQEIASELSDLNILLKKTPDEGEKTNEERFIREVKRRLSHEEYEDIWATVKGAAKPQLEAAE